MVPPSPEREGLAPSQQAQALFDGLEQQHLQSRGEQLQSLDAPKLYFDGYRGSEDFMADPLGIQDDVDLSKMLPSQMLLGDLPRQPKIGCALRAELARLSETEQEWEMARLRMMMEEQVERQNEAVRNRLMFARLERRVPANIVFDLSSDPENNGEDEGAAASQTVKTPMARPRPHNEEEAATAAQMVETATMRPRPRPLVRPQRPEENREAEGPLQDPGSNPALEHPELNQEAEGPLMCLHANSAIEPPQNPGAIESSQNPRENVLEGDAPQVERGWWDEQDTEKWTPELVSAFEGFARGRTWGGGQWQTCVSLLMEFEKITGFHDKGTLKAPDKKAERPREVADFMQLRRQWDTPFLLQTEIGSRTVEDSFAQRWWMWWKLGQPASRLETENEWVAPAELDSESGER
jgi:hypothetical protein